MTDTNKPERLHDRAEPARRPGQPGAADEKGERTVVDPNPGRRRDPGGHGLGLDGDPPGGPREPEPGERRP